MCHTDHIQSDLRGLHLKHSLHSSLKQTKKLKYAASEIGLNLKVRQGGLRGPIVGRGRTEWP